MPKGNILFLLDASPPTWRTPEDFHYRLCRELAAAGVQPVLTFARPLPPEIHERMASSGAVVTALAYNEGRRRYAESMGKLIRDHGIRMVHVRFFDYFSGIPWMARIHGVRDIVFTEANSGELGATSWKAQAVRLRTKLTCAPLTKAIAISRFIGDRLVACGIPAEKVEVVYNGVDLARFTPDSSARAELERTFDIRPDEAILATVTSLLPWKQPQVMIEACGELNRRGTACRLLIAGQGPMREELEALAGRLEIAGKVHWLGQTAQPERILQGCDVFLLSSIGEAFGNVLVEAMACGAPVVASRSGAIGEIVEEGKSGLLATPGDPGSFAGAIQEMLTGRKRLAAMREAAIERAPLFSVEKSVQRTLAVYESIWRRR
jgi:glycosyltransferase involved in cell wall biosynthesis